MNVSDTALSKATIQTDHLLSNIHAFKERLTPHTKFMAVIKADAYSHGAVPLAREMEAARAADYFGVAQLREALELREAGIQTPILVFNSVRAEEIVLAIQKNISLTVFSTEVAQEVVSVAEKSQESATVHLKIDSGMARLGVTTFEEAKEVYDQLQSKYIQVEGIYTHFADAQDLAPDNFTHEQFARFKKILTGFEKAGVHFALRHCCNTAATMNYPEYHLDMVRVGLGLYGLNPTTYKKFDSMFTPIQTVETTVTHVKDFPAGETVGYLRNFKSTQPMRIATIAIGYADGVVTSLSNKGYFTYNGHRLPILGEVCMDQIMLDVTEVEDLKLGDLVTYFGHPKDGNLLLTEVAKMAGASQYDLLCRMSQRVKRIYSSEE